MTDDRESEVFDRKVLRGIWLDHRKRASQSLATSRRLGQRGEYGPAFVWAVRAVEIFVRECLLFPHFYEQLGDVRAAYRKARESFGTNWTKALAIAMEAYSPSKIR
jgi:HEPN domain-containing protein